MSLKLFAVYLGGRAEKAKTELHDVVFVVGRSIEDTYEQLMDKWFGHLDGLHLDSWLELDVVDGHTITLTDTPNDKQATLYFINLGAYQDGGFTEVHANMFLVAESLADAKARGKRSLLLNWPTPVHTDDLHDVDDCLVIERIKGLHVVLKKTDQKEALKPVNGYHLIPKDIVEDYRRRIASEPKKGNLLSTNLFGDG